MRARRRKIYALSIALLGGAAFLLALMRLVHAEAQASVSFEVFAFAMLAVEFVLTTLSDGLEG